MLSDLRYAIRSFLNTPALAATIVVTLALGIGANTAIFSVIDAVLVRPAPWQNIDRPADPATFGGVAALLAIVALVATVAPARSAAHVDPVITLRSE